MSNAPTCIRGQSIPITTSPAVITQICPITIFAKGYNITFVLTVLPPTVSIIHRRRRKALFAKFTVLISNTSICRFFYCLMTVLQHIPGIIIFLASICLWCVRILHYNLLKTRFTLFANGQWVCARVNLAVGDKIRPFSETVSRIQYSRFDFSTKKRKTRRAYVRNTPIAVKIRKAFFSLYRL